MKLRLITGRPGIGKTYLVKREIASSFAINKDLEGEEISKIIIFGFFNEYESITNLYNGTRIETTALLNDNIKSFFASKINRLLYVNLDENSISDEEYSFNLLKLLNCIEELSISDINIEIYMEEFQLFKLYKMLLKDYQKEVFKNTIIIGTIQSLKELEDNLYKKIGSEIIINDLDSKIPYKFSI